MAHFLALPPHGQHPARGLDCRITLHIEIYLALGLKSRGNCDRMGISKCLRDRCNLRGNDFAHLARCGSKSAENPAST